jgi:hypothetical protein
MVSCHSSAYQRVSIKSLNDFQWKWLLPEFFMLYQPALFTPFLERHFEFEATKIACLATFSYLLRAV